MSNTHCNRSHRFGKSDRRDQKDRQGAAAVEFAVILPLFLLLLAGIIEFGQAFKVEHLLSSACRRGTRAAVVEGATSSKVEKQVKAQCVETMGVNEADITVEITVNGNANTDLSLAKQGHEISVTVSIPFSKAASGFFAQMFSNSILASTCTFEHE